MEAFHALDCTDLSFTADENLARLFQGERSEICVSCNLIEGLVRIVERWTKWGVNSGHVLEAKVSKTNKVLEAARSEAKWRPSLSAEN